MPVVIVAEDEPFIMLDIVHRLADEGYEVLEARMVKRRWLF